MKPQYTPPHRIALCLAISVFGHILFLAHPGRLGTQTDHAHHASQGHPTLRTRPPLTVNIAPKASIAHVNRERAVTLEKPEHVTSTQTTSAPGTPIVWEDWDASIPRFMMEGLIPGPRYLPQSELHKQATLLFPIKPLYPEGALEISGKVLVLVLINERGDIDRVGVIESSPPFVFDHSALAAFRDIRYAPGLVADIPVKSKLLIEITYEPGAAPKASLQTAEPQILQLPVSEETKSLGKGN